MVPVVRPETPADHEAIRDLTQRAFASMAYAEGDEHELIGRLRDAGALTISLVAESGGRIVGHVAFSPALADDGSPGWYALGPVSAEPQLQHQGIGRALITAGLELLRQRDAAGCILVGNPAYYARFGFRPFPALSPETGYSEFYQILPLRIAAPDIVVRFHPLFNGTAE